MKINLQTLRQKSKIPWNFEENQNLITLVNIYGVD